MHADERMEVSCSSCKRNKAPWRGSVFEGIAMVLSYWSTSIRLIQKFIDEGAKMLKLLYYIYVSIVLLGCDYLTILYESSKDLDHHMFCRCQNRSVTGVDLWIIITNYCCWRAWKYSVDRCWQFNSTKTSEVYLFFGSLTAGIELTFSGLILEVPEMTEILKGYDLTYTSEYGIVLIDSLWVPVQF